MLLTQSPLNMMIKSLIVAFAFLFSDFTTAIKDYNLTKLWRADTFQAEGDGDIFPFPEPLGYIGENYQRFFIHYITVTKSADNPYQYIVYGKTKVKDNICSFTGTITVKKATIEKSMDSPGYREGLVTCDVLFYEDSTHAGSGIIKGQLLSGFSLDKKGKFQYDALMFMADGFANNSCRATWTSYKTGKSKKCNWGDYRIPDSGDLDIGAGEISINEKYQMNGWEDFMNIAGEFKETQWWK